MTKNKSIVIVFVLIFLGMVCLLIGMTYSFFNYTRTGLNNNIGTGRINFNTSQSDTLNITNLFPMTEVDAGNANLDEVTISITGDTTYADGEEFEVTLVDINNTLNGKRIPINYIATYTANTGGTIGTSNNDYWDDRNDKDANIYLLNSTGNVVEDAQVLVGYIDNGQTGINGTLSIKAYIDADKVAITDTYPPNDAVILNSSLSSTQINDCVNFLTSEGAGTNLQTGETLADFCAGTGTIGGITFQEYLKQGYYNAAEYNFFIEHNINIIT